MNIFFLDMDPETCAKYHANTHTVKMILEYAQILSTAHRILDGDDHLPDWVYKVASKNHPSTVWARASLQNYQWLAQLLRHLATEYTYRYGKVHMTEQKGLVDFLLENTPKNIPDRGFLKPYLAMPDYCKSGDTIQSYRLLYVTEKLRLLKYKNREIPEWVLNANIPDSFIEAAGLVTA